MKPKIRYLFNFIRIGVALVALYFAFRKLNFIKIGEQLRSMETWVFFAVAVSLYIVAQLVFVSRWRVLLWSQKVHIDFWIAVRLHFLGLFYNNCLPGSVGGDVLRAWYVTKHTDKKFEAALSVFVDRVVGMGSTLAMAMGAYWLIPSGQIGEKFKLSSGELDLAGKISSLWPVFAAAAGVFVVAALIMSVLPKGKRLLSDIRQKSSAVLAKSLRAARLYLHSPIAFIIAVILSFCCQSLAITGFWLVGRNLGIEASVRYYFMFYPLSWLIGVIPISIGGAGVMELGLNGMFGMLNTVAKSNVALPGLVQRVVLLLVSIPGVIIHISGAHLPGPEELKSEITRQGGDSL